MGESRQIGAYDNYTHRWERTEKERIDTDEFIDNFMPIWRSVPDTIQLTVIHGTHDKSTDRWIGTQLSRLSSRNGERSYYLQGPFDMTKKNWYIVITAEIEGHKPKLIAFTAIQDMTEKSAAIQWYVSGQGTIGQERVSLGTLLILTSLYLVLAKGPNLVELQAINIAVATIYYRYGFRAYNDPEGAPAAGWMRIKNVKEASIAFDYEGKTNDFVRRLKALFTTDKNRLEFYNSIRGSDDRVVPLSLKSDMIWAYSKFVVKRSMGSFPDRRSWINSYMNLQFKTLPRVMKEMPKLNLFKRERELVLAGYQIFTLKDVFRHFSRISEVIAAQIEEADVRIVVVLPASFKDRNFVATLMFLSVIDSDSTRQSIRFLDLGQPDVFSSDFTSDRHVIFYYPIDYCATTEADLQMLDAAFSAIRKAAVGLPRFSIYCTVAFATSRVLKLCERNHVATFRPVVIPTVRELAIRFDLLDPTETLEEDDIITCVFDYVDARKLPILAIAQDMFSSPRSIPMTKDTYESSHNASYLIDLQQSRRVQTTMPLFDLVDLMIESLTKQDPTFKMIKPQLDPDETFSVFSYISAIDPSESIYD